MSQSARQMTTARRIDLAVHFMNDCSALLVCKRRAVALLVYWTCWTTTFCPTKATPTSAVGLELWVESVPHDLATLQCIAGATEQTTGKVAYYMLACVIFRVKRFGACLNMKFAPSLFCISHVLCFLLFKCLLFLAFLIF